MTKHLHLIQIESYQYKYINNWKIFVKRDSRSAPVHVASPSILKSLLGKESNLPPTTSSSTTSTATIIPIQGDPPAIVIKNSCANTLAPAAASVNKTVPSSSRCPIFCCGFEKTTVTQSIT